MTEKHDWHFNRPLAEVIKSRYSVRTYRPEKLPDEVGDLLLQYAAGIKGPFGPQVRLEFIDGIEAVEKTGGKIGTYGIIKGAQHYIAAVGKNVDGGLEQVGYVLEKLILYAASLGLGTCWLGGMFKRSQFAKLVDLQEDEILPAVTPVGYPGDKKTAIESFMRFAAGSNKRKPWRELFFNESFTSPLEEKQVSKEYREALEAVRLAPSASNKQPWRIVKQGRAYHFYLKLNKRYASALGFNIQKIDMGIAMCHFEMVLQEFGIKGKWLTENLPADTDERENLFYTVSWVGTAD
ncbi:MAG: nitroreductase family protein [Bacillota bacterium]|nr:nitroreductase family protein [Bacillota bacterium]MDW7684573.1 nitroreductase family protein [Bacillota bacterium]